MSFELNAIFSLSIGLSVLIGWMRFPKTDPAFLPFLILVSVAFANEITSILFAINHYTNIINFNSFQLIESVLITWQFSRWGFFGKHKTAYWLLQIFFVLSWIAEMIAVPAEFNSYFVIVHSFIIVMMSVHCLSGIAAKESTSLFRHPVSLICMGLIIYFTYALLVECFWIVGFNHQRVFRLKIYEIMGYINLVTNLVFAFAFLWIPMKPQYIMQS
jgi:hypothetical protein